MRGYLLTRDPELLEPYERGLENEARFVPEHWRRCSTARARPLADPDAAVEEAARTWQDSFASPTLAAGKAGTSGPSVSTGQGPTSTRSAPRIKTQQTRLDSVQSPTPRTTFAQARSERDHVLLAPIVCAPSC